jgi:organic hydroperoxide reductase OsmC/OhrA
LAERSNLEYTDLEVEVEGWVRKADSGYAFKGIVIRPNLTIFSGEDRAARGLLLLQRAKSVCLVARALAVEQKFEPRVQAGESRVEFSQVLPAV